MDKVLWREQPNDDLFRVWMDKRRKQPKQNLADLLAENEQSALAANVFRQNNLDGGKLL